MTKGGDPDTLVRELGVRISSELDIEPATFAAIQRGLLGVTTEARGTATTAFRGFPLDIYPVAGKTGTAEVDSKLPDGTDRADTAVFAAYGPVYPGEVPDYTVAMILEESGFGGSAAAPFARKLFDIFAGIVEPPTLEPGGALVPVEPGDGDEGDDGDDATTATTIATTSTTVATTGTTAVTDG